MRSRIASMKIAAMPSRPCRARPRCDAARAIAGSDPQTVARMTNSISVSSRDRCRSERVTSHSDRKVASLAASGLSSICAETIFMPWSCSCAPSSWATAASTCPRACRPRLRIDARLGYLLLQDMSVRVREMIPRANDSFPHPMPSAEIVSQLEPLNLLLKLRFLQMVLRDDVVVDVQVEMPASRLPVD